MYPKVIRALWEYSSAMGDYEKRKHNEPISIILKRYLDKDGGKVSNSRREIHNRFYALDWKCQKQILYAFLQSGRYDREWAYTQLYAVWDDCFIPVLKELWEQYHEKRLSWLIIRVFPIDYLKKEFENLSEGRNYFFLFLRLHNETDFVLDKTRLNEADLLGVKIKLREEILDDDVRDIFFLILYKLCKGMYEFRALHTIDYHTYLDKPLLRIFNNSIVGTLLSVLYSYGPKFDMYLKLKDWILQVTDAFLNEYGDLDDYKGTDREEYLRERITEFCLKQIPLDYVRLWESVDQTNKQEVLDVLEQRHKEHIAEEEMKRKSGIVSSCIVDDTDAPFGKPPF